MYLSKDVAWGGSENFRTGACLAGRKCGVWLYIAGIKNDKLLISIDKKIDNSNGTDKGSFRWSDLGADPYYIQSFYEMFPAANPND